MFAWQIIGDIMKREDKDAIAIVLGVCWFLIILMISGMLMEGTL